MTTKEKEYVVSSYMLALGNEKLSEKTWKQLAKVNAKIIENHITQWKKEKKG